MMPRPRWPKPYIDEILARVPCEVSLASPDEAQSLRYAIYRALRHHPEPIRITIRDTMLVLTHIPQPIFQLKETPKP